MDVNADANEIQKIIDLMEPSADINDEAFKYWIHCNRCYEIYPMKRVILYFLSCHHVLCANCLTSDSNTTLDSNKYTYKCSICSNIVRGRALGNDMPRHLKELFHPNPWVSDVPTARIFKFQYKHRNHIMSAIDSMEIKFAKREQIALELADEVQSRKDEIQKLIHENATLERRVRPLLAAYKERRMLKALEKSKMNKKSFRKRTVADRRSMNAEPLTLFHEANSFASHKRPRYDPVNAAAPNCGFGIKSNQVENFSFKNQNIATSFIRSRPNSSFFL